MPGAGSSPPFRRTPVRQQDQARAQRTASAFEISKVYNSLDEAINSAPRGAVYDIAVPASAILDILPHIPDGAGALIQKPMGENRQTARAILDLCHAKNLKAGINFQLRYAPFVLAARSIGSKRPDPPDRKAHAAVVDEFRNRNRDRRFALVSTSTTDEGVSVITAVSQGLTGSLKAPEVMKKLGLRGGGRPEFAQGGGVQPGDVDALRDRARELLREVLEKGNA